ncbi:AAA family ATPase [Candidatus Woesearchaeota archaeon]|nr:AAA family ATPase [Candidatus Woesearchaeota archaeon]
MTVVVVTGVPATGKTTLAKKLAIALSFEYVDGNAIAKTVSDGYDKIRDCEIIDVKKLNVEFEKIIKEKKSVVIDSHLAHELPAKIIDFCIVCKTNLKTLKERLKTRGYSKEKIRENLDAEIFDTVFVEAKNNNHNLIVFDDSSKIEDLIKIIKK